MTAFTGRRTVGCVTYLVENRSTEPLWTNRDPLVIERVGFDQENQRRAYWVSDKYANIHMVYDTDLQDPFGYYERAR